MRTQIQPRLRYGSHKFRCQCRCSRGELVNRSGKMVQIHEQGREEMWCGHCTCCVGGATWTGRIAGRRTPQTKHNTSLDLGLHLSLHAPRRSVCRVAPHTPAVRCCLLGLTNPRPWQVIIIIAYFSIFSIFINLVHRSVLNTLILKYIFFRFLWKN